MLFWKRSHHDKGENITRKKGREGKGRETLFFLSWIIFAHVTDFTLLSTFGLFESSFLHLSTLDYFNLARPNEKIRILKLYASQSGINGKS